MNEWIGEWMIECSTAWVNEWTKERMNEWMNDLVLDWMIEWMVNEYPSLSKPMSVHECMLFSICIWVSSTGGGHGRHAARALHASHDDVRDAATSPIWRHTAGWLRHQASADDWGGDGTSKQRRDSSYGSGVKKCVAITVHVYEFIQGYSSSIISVINLGYFCLLVCDCWTLETNII